MKTILGLLERLLNRVPYINTQKVEKASNFFLAGVALTAGLLLLVCLDVPRYFMEIMSYIAKRPLPMALIILGVAITIWLARKESKKGVKEGFPHDGLEGLFQGLSIMSTVVVGFIFGIVSGIITIVYFHQEIFSLVSDNVMLVLFIIFLLAVLLERLKIDHDKEIQERRYANKILMDQGLKPLKE